MGENSKCTSCKKIKFIKKIAHSLNEISEEDIEKLLNVLDGKEIIEYIKKKQGA